MRRLALLAACAIALLGAGCGGTKDASSSPATTTSNRVAELKGIAQLRAAFNAHEGAPRLIVLASPT
jgi:hypothetical protein